MRWQYAPFIGTNTWPLRGTMVPMAASTEKVPLPCRGTHSCVCAAWAISSKCWRTRVVIRLKSASHEPQSRNIACRVCGDVVKGPGVKRMGCSVVATDMMSPSSERHALQCVVQVRQTCVLLINALVNQPYNRHTRAEVATVSDASAAAGPMSPASSRFMMATDDKMVSDEYRKTTHDRLANDTKKKERAISSKGVRHRGTVTRKKVLCNGILSEAATASNSLSSTFNADTAVKWLEGA